MDLARQVSAYPPRVLTDPAGRCAAALLGHSQLAMLPAIEVRH